MLTSKKTAFKTQGIVVSLCLTCLRFFLLLYLGRKETQKLIITNLLRFALLDPAKVEQKSKQSELDDSICDLRH
jgi:hypothetical protein